MPARLHLVSDEYGRAVVFRGVRIVASPERQPPFTPDALTFEEDTNLLMSPDVGASPPEESFGQLVADMAAFEPPELGSVVARGQAPVRLLAIIHDIEKSPTWSEGSVREAIAAVLRKCESLDLKAVGLPVLGAVHGSLPATRFAGLLRIALEQYPPKHLKRIWIRASDRNAGKILEEFR